MNIPPPPENWDCLPNQLSINIPSKCCCEKPLPEDLIEGVIEEINDFMIDNFKGNQKENPTIGQWKDEGDLVEEENTKIWCRASEYSFYHQIQKFYDFCNKLTDDLSQWALFVIINNEAFFVNSKYANGSDTPLNHCIHKVPRQFKKPTKKRRRIRRRQLDETSWYEEYELYQPSEEVPDPDFDSMPDYTEEELQEMNKADEIEFVRNPWNKFTESDRTPEDEELESIYYEKQDLFEHMRKLESRLNKLDSREKEVKALKNHKSSKTISNEKKPLKPIVRQVPVGWTEESLPIYKTQVFIGCDIATRKPIWRDVDDKTLKEEYDFEVYE